MIAERGLPNNHSAMARRPLHYAPIPNQRIRREMRRPNRFWRVDETYVRVAGKWTYLYLAIDFLLSPQRDLIAAKGTGVNPRFLLTSLPLYRVKISLR